MKQILRYPRLDTVLMVEDTIKKHDGEFKKKQLWEALPKRMMYQTFCVVIDYLIASNKIGVDADGYIVWVFYPKIAAYYRKHPELHWNSSEED